jgi:hypothetical protein
MLVLGSFMGDFGAAVGVLAGMIAVTGFLAHAGPALSGASEEEVRRAMVRGGLGGFAGGSFVVVLSAFISRMSP